ncbi:MAG: hypothetical protein VW338_00260 [Rhodospirillaceae bacterium]
MAQYGAAGGFSAGLQGGLDAGARLNANSLAARDAKVKSALTMRGMQIDEARIQQDAKSKEQAKYKTMLDEVYTAWQSAVVAGGPQREQALANVQKYISPLDVGGSKPGPSPLQTAAILAGLPPAELEMKFRSLFNAPTVADVEGRKSEATTGGRIDAELAKAPDTRAAAAAEAEDVAAATVTGRVGAETANRGAIAANAGAVTAAQEGAKTPTIVELQNARDKALALGTPEGVRRASEIEGEIAARADPTGAIRTAGIVPAKEVRVAAENLRIGIRNLNEVMNLQGMIEKSPMSVGFVGGAIEKIDGIVGQLETVTGLDLPAIGTDEFNQARTQARSVVTQMITGMESAKRLTEGDIRRANEQVKVLESASSIRQVKNALQTISEIMDRANLAQADQYLANVELLTDKGAEEAFSTLRKNGMSKEMATDYVARLQLQRQ